MGPVDRSDNQSPSSMASTSNPRFREKTFYKAQLAIEAGRAGDSVKFMMELVKSLVPWTGLSLSEGKFLSTALMKFFEEYSQTLNDLKYRSVDADDFKSEVVQFFLDDITETMASACKEMKQFIYRWLIMSSRSDEATVFYLTLLADVSCYLIEVQEDAEVQAMCNEVIKAYKDAKAVAKARLTWASPARLTLALHMSEFYTEIMQTPEKGVKMAKKALAGASAAAGTVTDGELLDEMNELMSKLHEYITIWTDDEDPEAGAAVSLADFLTEAILAQVGWPSDATDEAANFRTQKAAEDAATTGSISALLSQLGAEDGISTSLAQFVVGNSQAQVDSPPDFSGWAKPAVELVDNSGTILALPSEPGADAESSDIFSMSVAGKGPESPPPASPPPPPALEEVEV